jgi:hypothetical protein
VVEEIGGFWDQVMFLAAGGHLPPSFCKDAGGLWAIHAKHCLELVEPLGVANGYKVNGRYFRPKRYALCESWVQEGQASVVQVDVKQSALVKVERFCKAVLNREAEEKDLESL